MELRCREARVGCVQLTLSLSNASLTGRVDRTLVLGVGLVEGADLEESAMLVSLRKSLARYRWIRIMLSRSYIFCLN
jgi:hypothetical protein